MKTKVNFPPKEVVTPIIGNPNFELIILWMLSNNETCSWSDFKKRITPSTLSLYLRKLIKTGFVIKSKHESVYRVGEFVGDMPEYHLPEDEKPQFVLKYKGLE